MSGRGGSDGDGKLGFWGGLSWPEHTDHTTQHLKLPSARTVRVGVWEDGAGTVSAPTPHPSQGRRAAWPEAQTAGSWFRWAASEACCWLQVGFTKIMISDKHGSPTSGFETFAR